jgi:hypothetical protein
MSLQDQLMNPYIEDVRDNWLRDLTEYDWLVCKTENDILGGLPMIPTPDANVDKYNFLGGLPMLPPQSATEENAGRVFVCAKWLSGIVGSIPEVTAYEVTAWKGYLESHYGTTSGSKKPKDPVVKKIVLINRLLLKLSQVPCQDSRLVEKLNIVQPDIIPGDERGVMCFIRPGRNFTVHDPLAFNMVFRELQNSHPGWPRRSSDRKVLVGTTGITEPLSALGLGPVEAGPWIFHNSNLRGPEDTDPEKKWCATKRKWTKNGKRDGMYYRRYEFNEERVAQRSLAQHVFDTLPPQ